MTEMFENRMVVLKSMVGSWASHLNTPESDEDWKYFITPTFDDLYTGKMFATANVSDVFDYDVHDIRQLSNLLWKANLNFIAVLFGYKTDCHPDLRWIFDHAEELATMNLPYFYNAVMGMHFEKMSKLSKGTSNTQILVDTFGYDTKQGCHAMRCLYVLERFMNCENMRYSLWFENGFHRDALINIKRGLLSLDEFIGFVDAWHDEHAGVKEWYGNQIPDVYLKEELDSRIKKFIRENL